MAPCSRIDRILFWVGKPWGGAGLLRTRHIQPMQCHMLAHPQSQLAFPDDAFRREVLRSANKGVGLEALLAASEIHQLGISSEIQDDILWFEVAVHDGAAVKILQGKRDAAPKKPQSMFKHIGQSSGIVISEGNRHLFRVQFRRSQLDTPCEA